MKTPKTPIRQGQLWQIKGYAQESDRVIRIAEVNADVVWVELKDGRKFATNRTALHDNYRLLTSHQPRR